METKNPTFSGEQTDKLGYYLFHEDWDLCVGLRGPSLAEQLSALHQSLIGIAHAACRHMDLVEEIFMYLKECYSNVSDMFLNM